MSKQLYIDPSAVRAPGSIHFEDIPVNRYQKTVRDEAGNFTKEQLVNIYRDMLTLREFETMINLIKTTGEYEGIAYNHPGPAHLSMGQEAAAVGEAFHLDVDDYIFGSHRAHSDILAKGLSAIEKLSDDRLLGIMRGFLGGATLAAVERQPHDTVKDLAIDFLLYGAMAEIFARETGFNRGLGGSMHTFFTPFGIYPNNAIVGGSGAIAMGAALYKRVNRQPGIVVANIGDGALGRGPVLEALNMAGMGQLTELWPDGMKGGLPVMFNIVNNQYGMGGQTVGETMAYDAPARLGAGFNPNQMLAERVDGFNPLAVIEAYGRKKKLLLEGKGPALLDVVTYRFAGHSPSDSSSYRTKEEIAAWEAGHPDPNAKTLEEEKVERIAQSKDDLDTYLKAHPITWTDGQQYSITREKQQQLTSKILSATLAAQTSTPYALTWNATGQECAPWALEDLAALAFAIDARVTALVSYQQAQEVAMREASTMEELNAIEVDYDTVQ